MCIIKVQFSDTLTLAACKVYVKGAGSGGGAVALMMVCAVLSVQVNRTHTHTRIIDIHAAFTFVENVKLWCAVREYKLAG